MNAKDPACYTNSRTVTLKLTNPGGATQMRFQETNANTLCSGLGDTGWTNNWEPFAASY